MGNFVGIDLGTTNSAITSYDGRNVRIWKSPEQNDVTPSAIYFDKRGNKYVGQRAYDLASGSPSNAALLFKRVLGTSAVIKFAALKEEKTPEECSAEVLRTLFGYLPEEIRKDPNLGIVITVPAAFNQLQKEATMKAADIAGLGNVSLMQEPVAAVMRVMQGNASDGTFLIFDFGGGTLDIAIAESVGGKVNLVAHGGIAMCGGRDFDRGIIENIVKPWLRDHFNIKDSDIQRQDSRLMRKAVWAAEKAKIELSAKEKAMISLSEDEVREADEDGEDIYLDIEINRNELNKLIDKRIDEAIESARETMERAGLHTEDIERIVFIGGPTNYKPIRDKVCFELGIKGTTEVNPMTAVAEGASLFAESIDWSSKDHARKASKGQINTGGPVDIKLNYIARTPEPKAKIAVLVSGNAKGMEIQIDSLDTGWNSGRQALVKGTTFDVPLQMNGENVFKVFVFEADGGIVSIKNDRILITRTAATVVGIPASHSVGMVVKEKLGGSDTLDFLVKAGDPLPKKGKKIFKAGESVRAGGNRCLTFNIMEGDIIDPVSDNRPIGCLKITGDDFDEGVIPAGAELECEYEILDSGNIVLTVSVPSIGATFSERNLYSWQGDEIVAQKVQDEAEIVQRRIDEISNKVDSESLNQAGGKVNEAMKLCNNTDQESLQEARNKVLDAKKLLAKARKENLKDIRQIDLDRTKEFFNEHVEKFTRDSEKRAFESMGRTAQRSIDNNDSEFENILDKMRALNFEILWRQDWFVVQYFNNLSEHEGDFSDRARFRELIQIGRKYRDEDNIAEIRNVCVALSMIGIKSSSGDEMGIANILRG